MKNNASKVIVIMAIIVALQAVLGFFPFVFMLPLLIIASYGNFKYTMFSATAFGIISLIYSFMGSSLISLAFISAPYIPVIPRIMVGFMCQLAYYLASLATRKMKNEKAQMYVKSVVVSAVGSLSNSLFVILALYFFTPNIAIDGTTIFLYIPTLMIMGVIELVTNIILAPPIATTVDRYCGKQLGIRKRNLIDPKPLNEDPIK